MIKLKIDVKKINKAHMHVGTKGTYLDCVLFTNRDGTDQYGNDGFVKQDIPKEARDAGEQGPIIGNWKDTDKNKSKPAPKAAPKPAPEPALDALNDEECPF